MSDRMINLFLRQTKKANDGLLPKDLEVTVCAGGEEIKGRLVECSDTAGCLILENKVPMATIKATAGGLPKVENSKEKVWTHYIRYEAITSIHTVT